MNESIEEFYAKIYSLAYITRYSGIPRIKDESVAEHSFFVASLVIRLHEVYYFNLGKALHMAIVHDWSEALIGDITYKVKKAYPSLGSTVEFTESEAMFNEFNTDVYLSWSERSLEESLEAKIVTMADILQVMQYAEHEVKLGNNGYMLSVVNSAKERLTVLAEQLNEFTRQ